MPASFAPLVFPGGIPSLHCPSTGRLVLSVEEGIDFDAPHTPHLRFVIDWLGEAFVVDPASLPHDQAAYQRRLVELLSGDIDTFNSENELVAACVAAMPASAIVFEVLDPPAGSSDGEIAYFGFDLALLGADVALDSVTLLPAEDFIADGDG
jgi:hypothetical protein